jgi:hypothetical protein
MSVPTILTVGHSIASREMMDQINNCSNETLELGELRPVHVQIDGHNRITVIKNSDTLDWGLDGEDNDDLDANFTETRMW